MLSCVQCNRLLLEKLPLLASLEPRTARSSGQRLHCNLQSFRASTLRTVLKSFIASLMSGLARDVQMIALKRTGTDPYMTSVDIIASIRIYKMSFMVSVFIFY